jgi:hypothetical protein
MELDRRHLHRPDHVRRMIDAELVGVPVEARKVHPHGLDPRWCAVGQPLLMHLLSIDAIGETVQHAGPVVESVDDAVGDRKVVLSKIKLGLPAR